MHAWPLFIMTIIMIVIVIVIITMFDKLLLVDDFAWVMQVMLDLVLKTGSCHLALFWWLTTQSSSTRSRCACVVCMYVCVCCKLPEDSETNSSAAHWVVIKEVWEHESNTILKRARERTDEFTVCKAIELSCGISCRLRIINYRREWG